MVGLQETEAAHQPHARLQKRKIKAGTKYASVLEMLLQRGDAGMNCFESVRWCHDYTLRSTISGLRREYGFTFRKKDEHVPGFRGSTVHCVRYSFAASDVELARELLGREDA